MLEIRPRAFLLALMFAMAWLLPTLAFSQVQEFNPQKGLLKAEKDSGKTRFFFRASRVYLMGGTVFDAATTARALNHPTLASTAEGLPLARYVPTETGWASCLSKRNTFAVVSANLALNTGVDLLSQKLYRKGGKWKFVAISLNLAKGTGSWIGGFHNIGQNSGIDSRIRLTTGYQGPIRWSR